VPDLVLADSLASAERPTAYLAMKVFIIGIMSALAIHGSSRIDMLNQQANVAKELGQYLLRRSLGEGGMGSVYLAEHRFLRRPCAVKLIRAEQASNEVALARFEREVQSAAALTHPNSVQIYDYGRSEDGTFYFAMEFLPGVPLDKLVDEHGPLPPARAVHVLAQICGALGEAHHRGFVHRDLKPGNVMLCERGGVHDVAKLLDFGLVAAVATPEDRPDRITKTGMVVGTPAFMSPEQCMGLERVTPASDIYSLGALGFFLLTGEPPFGERQPMQALMAHVNETPRLASDVNPAVPIALAQVIARCLAKKPEDRFPTVEAVQEALLRSVERQLWTPANARTWWLATQGAPVSA
jgi:eukaryotic-like serine/threonine-protein kinase